MDTTLYVNATLSILNFNSDYFVGISGGEPTFNREAFLLFLRTIGSFGNDTPLHVLTNGRSFSDNVFAENVFKALGGRDVLWGIPLYGHNASSHDYLVDAAGAFDETILGLLRLGELNQTIELRIIPTKDNLHLVPHIIMLYCSSLWIYQINIHYES